MSVFSGEPAGSLGRRSYIYTYACTEEELALCELEQRAMFGVASFRSLIESPLGFEVSRSPFVKERIEVLWRGESLAEVIDQVKGMPGADVTHKVVYVRNKSASLSQPSYEERCVVEREVGRHVQGRVDMRRPELVYGVMQIGEEWIFGICRMNEAKWLQHQQKPQNYSTALDTRMARAIVNIAAPQADPADVSLIDPCCGMGTVLVEALSMGLRICGSDRNPLAVAGARVNLAHFFGGGMERLVQIRDIEEITGRWDAVILDMPYNLCSVVSPEEKLEMLRSARRIAGKAVVVTVEPMNEVLEQAGFRIIDRCEVKKGLTGSFKRQVLVGV